MLLCHHVNPPVGGAPIKLAPIDCCVYCGETTGPLGTEHLFPESLGGGILLPRATCPCGPRRTHAFEGEAVNQYFNQARKYLGIKGKKRKRSENSNLFKIWDGPYKPNATLEELGTPRLIPAEEHPSILLIPRLNPLQLLGHRWFYRKDRSGTFQQIDAWRLREVAEPYNAHFTLKYDALLRLLAKIGHCAAVSCLGFDSFTHKALPLIGGNFSNFNEIVGEWPAETESTFPFDYERGLHNVSVSIKEIDGRKYVIAQIRMFSCLLWRQERVYEDWEATRLTPSYAVNVGSIP